jgi:hypothetical protein
VPREAPPSIFIFEEATADEVVMGTITIVREPPNNVYGHYKVLRRTDGLFVVKDMRVLIPPPWGSVHASEREARDVAAMLARDGDA